MRFLLIHSFLLFATASYSQEVDASISKKNLNVGDTATIFYTLTSNSIKKPQFLAQNQIIPSYLINKNGSVSVQKSNDIECVQPFYDTIYTKGNQKFWVGKYKITIWDSGSYLIKGPKIISDDSTIYFPDLTIHSNFIAAVSGKDIYDIEEHFTKLPEETIIGLLKNNGWIAILILFISVAIFLYLRKRKNNFATPPVRAISLKKRTLLAIDGLEKSKLWKKNQLKEHFVELSFILRSYLSSRFEIQLLERTTKDALLLLKQKGLSDDILVAIKQILEESDLVKFAKSKPSENDILKVSAIARQVIYQTSPIETDLVD